MTSLVTGCTAHPDAAWDTQQARQMTWKLRDRDVPMRYLIHDHDTKFTGAFDTVFESEGIEIADISYEAPNANALATRLGAIGARRMSGPLDHSQRGSFTTRLT